MWFSGYVSRQTDRQTDTQTIKHTQHTILCAAPRGGGRRLSKKKYWTLRGWVVGYSVCFARWRVTDFTAACATCASTTKFRSFSRATTPSHSATDWRVATPGEFHQTTQLTLGSRRRPYLLWAEWWDAECNTTVASTRFSSWQVFTLTHLRQDLYTMQCRSHAAQNHCFLLFSLSVRRYISAGISYIHDVVSPCVCVCLSVCLSHVGIVRKGCTIWADFWAHRFLLTYHTLHFKRHWDSCFKNKGILPSGILS